MSNNINNISLYHASLRLFVEHIHLGLAGLWNLNSAREQALFSLLQPVLTVEHEWWRQRGIRSMRGRLFTEDETVVWPVDDGACHHRAYRLIWNAVGPCLQKEWRSTERNLSTCRSQFVHRPRWNLTHRVSLSLSLVKQRIKIRNFSKYTLRNLCY
jgi:hypothetical protein